MSFFDKLKIGLSKTKSNIDEKINGVFSNLFKNPTNNIEVKYKGYMKDGKAIIERG